MNIFLLLIIVIVVHEFGHLMAYAFTGYSPKIKITFFGILIGENVYYRLNVSDAFLINVMGILFGLFPLIIFNSVNTAYWMLVYLLMCCIDITNIIQLLSLKKSLRTSKLSLLAISELQLKELKKQYKKGLKKDGSS